MLYRQTDFLIRVHNSLVLRLPYFIKSHYIKLINIQAHCFRALRWQLIKQNIKLLTSILEKIGFAQGIFINDKREVLIESDGIFLNTKLTNRYYKVTTGMPGNEGKTLLDRLSERQIEVKNFVDVGANFAEISLYFCKKIPGCQILSIEASPDNFQILMHNLKAQHFDTSCIQPVQMAAADTTGTVDISVGLGAATTIITDQRNTLRNEVAQTAKVAADTLSNILKTNGFDKRQIDFMKIDIEGSEPLLSKDLIKIKPRVLFIEFANKNSRQSYLELAKTLLDFYSCETEEGEHLAEFAAVEKYLHARWDRHTSGTTSRGCDLWFFLN